MWGQSISSGVTNLGDIFAETSCENGIATTPDVSTTPPGPFCYTCTSVVAFSTKDELKQQVGKAFEDQDRKYGYVKIMT